MKEENKKIVRWAARITGASEASAFEYVEAIAKKGKELGVVNAEDQAISLLAAKTGDYLKRCEVMDQIDRQRKKDGSTISQNLNGI